eukprot:g8858.t1
MVSTETEYSPSSSLASRVSVLVTTSAIPLNPSTRLIDVLLRSLANHVFCPEDDLPKGENEKIAVFLLCDGYDRADVLCERTGRKKKKASYKACRISDEDARNYDVFVERLKQKYEEEGREGRGVEDHEDHDEDADLVKRRFRVRVVELGIVDEAADPYPRPVRLPDSTDDLGFVNDLHLVAETNKAPGDHSASACPMKAADHQRQAPRSRRNLGFANAVRYGVERLVTTPYILVAQHDYIPVRHFPLRRLVQYLDSGDHVDEGEGDENAKANGRTSEEKQLDFLAPPPTILSFGRSGSEGEGQDDENFESGKSVFLEPAQIDYVGFDSLTTSEWAATKVGTKSKSKSGDAASDSWKPREDCNSAFLPLSVWYDKTHLCRATAYRKLFGEGEVEFPPGSFIEDVFINNRVKIEHPGTSNEIADEPITEPRVIAAVESTTSAADESAATAGSGGGPAAEDVGGRSRCDTGRGQHDELELDHNDNRGAKKSKTKCDNKYSKSEPKVRLGVYVLRQAAGPAVYHLSGRKLQENDADKNKLGGGGTQEPSNLVGADADIPNAGNKLGAAFGMFAPREAASLNKKFTGNCFKCGQKGHSGRFCPHVEAAGVT